MIGDFFILALKNLRRRKLRSWLTVLGIFIGITAVVTLISLSQGMRDSINEQFEKIGKSRIMIVPGGAFFGPMSSSASVDTLSEREAELVNKIHGIELASGIISDTGVIEYKDELESFSVWGMHTDSERTKYYKSIGLLDIGKGREFKASDNHKAIIGHKIAYETYEEDIHVGNKITINGIDFNVIGIQNEIGTGMHDSLIRIPIESARELFEKPNNIDVIIAKVADGENIDDVIDEIEKVLRKYRDVDEGEEDFSVQSSAQTIEQLNGILAMVQGVLVGIAAISLLVGGIGIMNTMYTSVLERTPEIGIMKAIGARNEDVFKIFLIESGILGLGGGIIGVILGVGISKLVEIGIHATGVTFISAYFSWYLIVGALSFSFIVGVLSGILPAMQASKLITVDALRYE